jgi:hypothetical protein
MKPAILALVLAPMLSAGALLALTAGGSASARDRDRSATVVCLDPAGSMRGPICKRGSVWSQDDICRCPDNTEEVTAPYCDKGEVPAGQSRMEDQARAEASRDGTLVGDRFHGRRFCVPPTRVPG